MADQIVKDTDWAWLAGLIEGEGHVGIHIHHRKYRRRDYPLPEIRIRNTDLRLLEAVRLLFGGGIRKVYDSGKTSNLGVHRKPYFEWWPKQSKIREIAESIKPFMKGLKAEEVNRILEFYKQPEVIERLRRWSHPKR